MIERKLSGVDNAQEQKLGTNNMKMAMKSFGVMSKGFQVLAAEIADYSKRSLEVHTAAMNRLMTAKTMQQTFEVQSEYVKTAYEAFVAQASRIGELYADLAKESCEPFEGITGRRLRRPDAHSARLRARSALPPHDNDEA